MDGLPPEALSGLIAKGKSRGTLALDDVMTVLKSVELSAEVTDDEVCFVVADEGPGIPGPQLTTIFGKFFRRSGERRSGTGLGLYISRGLVEAHGGRIWAESELENGSHFHFTLPRGGLELAGIDLPTLGAAFVIVCPVNGPNATNDFPW